MDMNGDQWWLTLTVLAYMGYTMGDPGFPWNGWPDDQITQRHQGWHGCFLDMAQNLYGIPWKWVNIDVPAVMFSNRIPRRFRPMWCGQ